jgi:hypothetical protein
MRGDGFVRNGLFLLLLFILASCGNTPQSQTPKTVDPNKISGNMTGTIIKKESSKVLIVSSTKEDNDKKYPASWITNTEIFQDIPIGSKVEVNLIGAQSASYPGLVKGQIVKVIDYGLYDNAKMKPAEVINLAINKVPTYVVPNPRNIAFSKEKHQWTIKIYDETTEDNKMITIDDSTGIVIN